MSALFTVALLTGAAHDIGTQLGMLGFVFFFFASFCDPQFSHLAKKEVMSASLTGLLRKFQGHSDWHSSVG